MVFQTETQTPQWFLSMKVLLLSESRATSFSSVYLLADVCYFYKAHSVYSDYGGIANESSEGEKLPVPLGTTEGDED